MNMENEKLIKELLRCQEQNVKRCCFDIMISLRRNKRVEAITKFRKFTDCPLMEAKDVIEDIEKTEFPKRDYSNSLYAYPIKQS